MKNPLSVTHVYIGRNRKCGCIVTVATDTEDAEAGKYVGAMAKDYNIERMTLQTYRDAEFGHTSRCKMTPRDQGVPR